MLKITASLFTCSSNLQCPECLLCVVTEGAGETGPLQGDMGLPRWLEAAGAPGMFPGLLHGEPQATDSPASGQLPGGKGRTHRKSQQGDRMVGDEAPACGPAVLFSQKRRLTLETQI